MVAAGSFRARAGADAGATLALSGIPAAHPPRALPIAPIRMPRLSVPRRVTVAIARVAVLACAAFAVRPLAVHASLPARLGVAVQPVDVTGRWAFAVTTENGTGYPTVTFKQAGEKVTGTYESSRMGVRPLEGTIKGDTLRFAFTNVPEGTPAFTFVAVLTDKDNLKGTLEMGGMGTATFTGRRER